MKDLYESQNGSRPAPLPAQPAPDAGPRNILVTGGAGFIGSHLCDELLGYGHRVRVLDNLCPQVHGPDAVRPDYLDGRVELHVGDCRDRSAVDRALTGVDTVYHLAAAVGVGQSMYEIEHYTSINNLGTAVLLEALIDRPVGRLIVASSMSIYGEGLYLDVEGRGIDHARRATEDLKRHRWEPRDADGRPMRAVATPESKCPDLASIYALGKYDQERMCLITGEAYAIPTTAMRFFNVYGTRQALSNPYTGVLAIFASRLMNDAAPMIFEDGQQQRDFVHVSDVARACRLAMDVDAAAGQVINVGSGQPRSVCEVAQRLAHVMGRDGITPVVTRKYRVGDIRHCFADISAAERLLGYRPATSFEEGLVELTGWLGTQRAHDRVMEASSELERRGLTV